MKLLFVRSLWIATIIGFPAIVSSQTDDTRLAGRISTTIADEFQTESFIPPASPVRDFAIEGAWSTGASVIPTARYTPAR